MSDPVPFDEFLAETASARPERYADALAAGARRAGITPEAARAEFERMKAHILSFYEGVRPVRSVRTAGGQTIDCVPFEQQPSVRTDLAEGRRVARTAPPPAGVRGTVSHGPRPVPKPAPVCPDGTVPIVRLTLDRLARFGTLERFFRKEPPPGGPPG